MRKLGFINITTIESLVRTFDRFEKAEKFFESAPVKKVHLEGGKETKVEENK